MRYGLCMQDPIHRSPRPVTGFTDDWGNRRKGKAQLVSNDLPTEYAVVGSKQRENLRRKCGRAPVGTAQATLKVVTSYDSGNRVWFQLSSPLEHDLTAGDEKIDTCQE